VREEHRFDFAAEQTHPVFEVDAPFGTVAAAVNVGLTAVGEQAQDGDRGRGGVELLLAAALGLPPESTDQALSAPLELLLPAIKGGDRGGDKEDRDLGRRSASRRPRKGGSPTGCDLNPVGGILAAWSELPRRLS